MLTLLETVTTRGLLPKVLLYGLSTYILLKRIKSNKLPGARYSRFQNAKQKKEIKTSPTNHPKTPRRCYKDEDIISRKENLNTFWLDSSNISAD